MVFKILIPGSQPKKPHAYVLFEKEKNLPVSDSEPFPG